MPINPRPQRDQESRWKTVDLYAEPREQDIRELSKSPDKSRWRTVDLYADEKGEDSTKKGSSLGAFAKTLARVPENLVAKTIMAVQGQVGASVANRGVADRYVNWVESRNRKLAEQYEGAGDLIPGLISKRDVAELGPNLAFSGVSMGGTVAGGTVAAPIPVPGARIAGAMTGGATAAYRMDAYQVMNDWLERVNQESIDQGLGPISREAEEKFKNDMSSLATEHGAWEAGPEGFANILEIALLTAKNLPGVKWVPKKLVGKVGKAALRFAGVAGVEAGTETVTQTGQQITESKAGMTEEAPRKWTSGDDILKSAKEVLPQVLLLSGFMSAGGATYRRAMKPKKETARDVLLDDDEQGATAKDILSKEEPPLTAGPRPGPDEFTGAESLDAEESAAAFGAEDLEAVAAPEPKIEAREKGVARDKKEEERLARAEREREKPGGAVPEPDAGTKKAERNRIFQTQIPDAPQKLAFNTPLGEITGDSAVRYAKLLGNISGTPAILEKGYASLSVPSRTDMLSGVLGAIENDKVFRSVIPFVPINMVNDLVGKKFSPQDVLDNKSMFIHSLSTSDDTNVVASIVDSIIRGPAIGATKGVLGVAVTGRRPAEDVPAIGAGEKIGGEVVGVLDDMHKESPVSMVKKEPTTKAEEVQEKKEKEIDTKAQEAATSKENDLTEIPTFTNTTEAETFGRKATPEQITELKKLRKESEKRYHALTEKGKLDEAGKEALTAQLYREAFEVAEKKPAKKVAAEKVEAGKEPWTKEGEEFESKSLWISTVESIPKYHITLLEKASRFFSDKQGANIDSKSGKWSANLLTRETAPYATGGKGHAKFGVTNRDENIHDVWAKTNGLDFVENSSDAFNVHNAYHEWLHSTMEGEIAIQKKAVKLTKQFFESAKLPTAKPPEAKPPEAARKEIKIEAIPKPAPKVEKEKVEVVPGKKEPTEMTSKEYYQHIRKTEGAAESNIREKPDWKRIKADTSIDFKVVGEEIQPTPQQRLKGGFSVEEESKLTNASKKQGFDTDKLRIRNQEEENIPAGGGIRLRSPDVYPTTPELFRLKAEKKADSETTPKAALPPERVGLKELQAIENKGQGRAVIRSSKYETQKQFLIRIIKEKGLKVKDTNQVQAEDLTLQEYADSVNKNELETWVSSVGGDFSPPTFSTTSSLKLIHEHPDLTRDEIEPSDKAEPSPKKPEDKKIGTNDRGLELFEHPDGHRYYLKAGNNIKVESSRGILPDGRKLPPKTTTELFDEAQWDYLTKAEMTAFEKPEKLTKPEKKIILEEASISKPASEMTADEMLAEWDNQAAVVEASTTAKEKAVETKTHLSNAAEAFKAINDILGEKGALSNEIDEGKWKKIRPLLKSAFDEIVAAGKTGAEFVTIAIKSLSPKGRPYFERFVKEDMGKGAKDDTDHAGGRQPRGTEKADDKGRRGGKGSEVVSKPKKGDVSEPDGKRHGETVDGSVQAGEEQGSLRGQRPKQGPDSAGSRHGDVDKANLGRDPGSVSGLQRSDHRIKPGALEREGSWLDAATNNLDAVELFKKIIEEKRPATPKEQEILAKYVGWGASELANNMFPGYAQDGKVREEWANSKWRPVVKRLKRILTPEEIKTATKSTKYAHYTNEPIIKSIYKALDLLGFTGGRILEPGVGIGNFVGLLPDNMLKNSHYTGLDMDIVSAGIAKLLYPNQNMMQADFISQAFPRNYFDAAIGNPPFSSTSILGDPEYRKYRFSLHNFFFAKALDRVRPGGLLVFVSSRYVMDSQGDKARKYITERANLLGAIRLPQAAFLKRAGTEVVTDVLFLQRRAEGEKVGGESWAGQKEIAVGDDKGLINEYFVDHPEMVLGSHSFEGSMYGPNQYTVKSFPNKIEDLFANAIKNLPTNVYRETKDATKDSYNELAVIERDFDPKNKKEGGIYVSDDGKVMKVDFGSGVLIEKIHKKITAPNTALLKGYVKLRDALKLSHKAQLEDGEWEQSLKELNQEYKKFVKKHGNILAYTRTERTKKNEDGTTEKIEYLAYKNSNVFGLDCESSLVYTLETITADGDIVKSKVLQGRTVKKPTKPKIESVPDALAVSLNAIGKLDVAHIADLSKKTQEEVIAGLGDLIYEQPDGSGQVLADEYLSGNVVKKLAEAKFAAKTNPDMARNVSALEDAQPEPLEPKQITVTPGATWIPLEHYEAFAAEVLELEGTKIAYQPIDNSWNVKGNYSPHELRDQTSDWGTEDRGANEILDAVLNNRTIRITGSYIDETGSKRTVFDAEATAAVNNIAKNIRSRFNSWVWEDKDRATSLLDIYNTKINVIKGREYDGSHLTLPGMSAHFKPYDHQKRVIWRILQSGNTYMAHAVGSGKTFIMIAAGMEMRRLGMINKPIYAVPKHMLGQFAQEFQELYPMANILVADEANFHTENRRRFMAQATLNDPDAIILTHSSFGLIGVKEETLAPVRDEFLEQMRYALSEMKEEGESKLTIKRMEKRIEKAEQRFNSLISSGDRAISFEEFGADYLFVDECFTHDTLVETDIGLIRIGDIVEKKLQVNVKSYNLETHVVEWKPVIDWYKKYSKVNLVEVSHEKGSFICTPNHRIWTSSGYKKAENLIPGEKLYIMREGIYSELHREEGEEGKVLFSGMQAQGRDHYDGMPGMRGRIPFQDKRPSERCEEAVLFNVMPATEQGKRQNLHGRLETEDASGMGQLSNEGKKVDSNVDSQEGKQPDVQQGNTGKDEKNPYWQKVFGDKGREREDTCSTTKVGRQNRSANGICDSDKENKRKDTQPAHLLQGGFSLPTSQNSNRNRRIKPQYHIGETAGQKKGHGIIPTRMVGFKILEQGGIGEYRLCGKNHKFVYDIEVEGNHNYFANGVLVSNSHEFRKLDFATNRQMKGIDPQGSRRSIGLYIKIMWLERQSKGRSHSFASGTPIVNTIGELYTVQRFFDSGEMEEDGINHFDAWANMFGEPATAYEMNAAGNHEPVERFAKFVNIPELMSRVRMFMDVLTSSQLGSRIIRPRIRDGAPKIVLAPKNDALETYQRDVLIPRIETSREWRPSPGQAGNPDPIINIITDGKLASIDMRFVDKNAKNDPDSKLNKYIDGIIETYFSTKDMEFSTTFGSTEKAPIKGGSQICFYNSGFGKGVIERRGFNAKAFLVKRLKDAGVSLESVAWIDDYKTAAQKQVLFKLIRSGEKRILLGSATKMGTGVNVQNRLTDLHYLDAPWLPANVEQPDGRIVRQGNQNKEVGIMRYATKGSYDATLWQMVARKSKFIDQAFTGDKNIRNIEDISETSQYEMAAALASGDERVVQLATLRADIERLFLLEGAHRSAQTALGYKKPQLESRVSGQKARLKEYISIEGLLPGYIGAELDAKVGEQKIKERKALGIAFVAKIKKLVAEESGEYVKLGTISGVDVLASPVGVGIKKLELELRINDVQGVVPNTFMGTEELGEVDPVGLTKKITNTINGLSAKRKESEQGLQKAEKELERVNKRVGVPFGQALELAEKIAEAAVLEHEITGEGVTEEEIQAASADQQAAKPEAFYVSGGVRGHEKYIELKTPVELLTQKDTGVPWAKTLYLHKSLNYETSGHWVVTERSSGLAAAVGNTRKETLDSLRSNLATVTEEEFNKRVEASIKKIGKPGEAKTPVYSRRKTATAGGGSKSADLQTAVDKTISPWKKAPTVKVVQSQSELPAIILEKSRGETIVGSYYKGTVYLVADNLSSTEAAIKSLLHESFGHYGLRELLGQDFSKIMDEVYIAKRAEIVKIAAEYGYDIHTLKGRVLAADEWMAREVINNPKSGWVKRVMAAIKKFVRWLYPSLKMSDAEIRTLLDEARMYVERGGAEKEIAAVEETPMFQIDAYHGSPHKFDKFETAKMGTGEGFQAIAWGMYFTDQKAIAINYAEIISKKAGTPKERQLYKVSIHKGKRPTEYEYLRWDKFVTPETKEKILEQLKKEFPEDSNMISWNFSYGEDKRGLTGRGLYTQLSHGIADTKNRKAGFEKFRPDQKEASLFLLRAGIDGIKYPAGTISGIESKGFDYVVFDENAVAIDEQVAFSRHKPSTDEIDTAGFLPKEVESRMAKAKPPRATFKEKLKETVTTIKHQKEHFPDLQTIEDKTLRAKVNDILRRHQEIPEAAKNKAIRLIASFTKNLSKDGYKVYRMNIILADMMRDIRNGLTYDGKLPFGFKTIAQVEEAAEKFKDVADKNSEIKKALKRRADAINEIKSGLVNAKLLKKEVLKDDDYFHHQIIKYWEKKYGMATGSKDVRTHWRPWMTARKGSPLDYNTDYIEAEFTAISQQLAQLGVVETLKRIKKDADIYASLKVQAKAKNIENLWKTLREKGQLDVNPKTGKEIDPLRPWKQKIAMSNTNLAQMASEGTLDYDSEWQGIVTELADSYDNWKADKDEVPDTPSPGVNDARWFDFLTYLINTKKPGAQWAATVYKAIREKNKYIEETLGTAFLTYDKIIPKGYTDWKVDPKKGWFWANVITDKILEKMQRGELDPRDVEAKKLLAKGRDLIWVIPEGLAKTMDDFKGSPEPAWVGNVADTAMRAWKQYILLNPYSVIRYNLNNMSGDLDACLAYAPEIVTKYMWKAFKDLRKWHKRKKLDPAIQKEIDFAQASGAIQSGFSMQEVDDVYSVLNTDKIVRDILTDEQPNWFSKTEWFGIKRAGANYWAFVRRVTALRENTLRLAAYRFFEDNRDKRLYGASKPVEVDAITDHKEQSAKKARELLGDYGNISRTGEYLRKRIIPFFSWLEINAPRYVYMMRNTKYENRDVDSIKKQMAAVAGKKLVLASGKMALRASMLMGAVILWNLTMFPDEEEELGESGRRQMHLILGRREDGTIITLRFQGALSDALSFFALEDWPSDMKDVLEGKHTVLDKLKEVPIALLNRGVQSIRPEPKMLGEMISGKSFYPDILRPMPIRDRIEHALRTFKLDRIYREALERPGRGKTPDASRAQQVAEHFIGDLRTLFVYEADPGLLAYYDVRNMVFEWLAKQGDEKRYGGKPTKKGNAFYYYKQALKYGDLDAAQRYLKKYYELGGTVKSRMQSMKYAHPLSSIPTLKRVGFRQSLTPAEQVTFGRALTWYNKTYRSQ